MVIQAGLDLLPHFNPDLDVEDSLPDVVRNLRTEIADADALLISVPEYAHGIPGCFKNMLDWLVGSTALLEKPIAIWTSNMRSTHAPTQLREILKTMAASIDEQSSIVIDVPSDIKRVEALLSHSNVEARVRTAVNCLFASAQVFKDNRP